MELRDDEYLVGVDVLYCEVEKLDKGVVELVLCVVHGLLVVVVLLPLW